VTSLGFQAVAILFILLPGFLAARIFQSLFVRPDQTEGDKVVDALLFSFLIYLAYVLSFGSSLPVSIQIVSDNGGQSLSFHLLPMRLFVLAAYALVFGLIMGYLCTNDISGKILRRLRLTQRTTRSSVWSDIFHELTGVVQVELADGRQLMGWLKCYSDEPKNASLFLERAAWINDDTSLVPISGPGILLTEQSGIKHVMFLDAGRSSIVSS
jgi:hypothetical protein